MLYELKVTLRDIEPPVWRLLQVSGNCSLHELHEVLQVAMGWTNSHLYLFRAGNEAYGEHNDDLDDWGEVVADSNATPLADFVKKHPTFVYEYDLGDSWEHEIVVQRSVADEAKQRAVCLDGARACPPEDCGGFPGYADLLDVLADPDNPEYREMRRWAGRNFDPERFDLDAVNRKLCRVSLIPPVARRSSTSNVTRLHVRPDPLGPARRMAEFIGAIVMAASIRPMGAWHDSAVRCRRRPAHRSCPGRMRVRCQAGKVDYECPFGHEHGVIANWQGGIHDLSTFRRHGPGPLVEFIVSENEYDVVNGYPALDIECVAILAWAVPTPAGISLRAPRRDWELFAEWLASEANGEVNRKRERVLDELLRRLERSGLY